MDRVANTGDESGDSVVAVEGANDQIMRSGAQLARVRFVVADYEVA